MVQPHDLVQRGLVKEAIRAQSQSKAWFVAQEWIGSAVEGTWQDVAAREFQRRLPVR